MSQQLPFSKAVGFVSQDPSRGGRLPWWHAGAVERGAVGASALGSSFAMWPARTAASSLLPVDPGVADGTARVVPNNKAEAGHDFLSYSGSSAAYRRRSTATGRNSAPPDPASRPTAPAKSTPPAPPPTSPHEGVEVTATAGVVGESGEGEGQENQGYPKNGYTRRFLP